MISSYWVSEGEGATAAAADVAASGHCCLDYALTSTLPLPLSLPLPPL